MIRTGGSLIGAARAYQRAGAVSLAAVATHGIFPGDALHKLQATGLFSAIACTDSHPRARARGRRRRRPDPAAGRLDRPLLAPHLAGHVL
nr:hypothetical protein [Nannocystis pusilla]